MKTFGELIREARKRKGWSFKELADKTSTYKSYLCGIEKGALNPPSPKMVRVLCRKLDLPIGPMLTLAHWEKRPKGVTAAELLKLLEGVITEQQQKEPETPHYEAEHNEPEPAAGLA